MASCLRRSVPPPKKNEGLATPLFMRKNFIIIIINYYYYFIIIKIETTLQPEAELRGLHIITCTTYKYIINTIL